MESFLLASNATGNDPISLDKVGQLAELVFGGASTTAAAGGIKAGYKSYKHSNSSENSRALVKTTQQSSNDSGFLKIVKDNPGTTMAVATAVVAGGIAAYKYVEREQKKKKRDEEQVKNVMKSEW
jgi:hypothetical protein